MSTLYPQYHLSYSLPIYYIHIRYHKFYGLDIYRGEGYLFLPHLSLILKLKLFVTNLLVGAG